MVRLGWRNYFGLADYVIGTKRTSVRFLASVLKGHWVVDTGDFNVVSSHILHSLNFTQEHFTPTLVCIDTLSRFLGCVFFASWEGVLVREKLIYNRKKGLADFLAMGQFEVYSS